MASWDGDTNIFSPTDLQYVIPELWPGYIQEEFEANLVLANLMLDMSAQAVGGDTINVPDAYTNTFSTNKKVYTSDVTLQSPATGNDQLVIDCWRETSFLIEDREAKQIGVNYDAQKIYMKNAAYTVAKDLDGYLAAEYANFGNNNSGNSATTLYDSDIRGAIKTLDNNDVPSNDRAFVFDPRVLWGHIMDVSKYYDASQSGWSATEAPMKKGVMGVLYGIPVYSSTNVTVASSVVENLLFQKQVTAYAQPMGIRVQSNYIPEMLGTLTTLDTLWGIKTLRSTAGYVLQSST